MKIKMVYLEHSCNTNKPANNSNNFYWFKILLPILLVYHINNEANKLSANSTLLNLSVKAHTFQLSKGATHKTAHYISVQMGRLYMNRRNRYNVSPSGVRLEW